MLTDGSLELINKGKPIRSEQTHFVFTLDGLAVRAFEDAGSLHFCAFISGSAKFKPEAAKLADGMFKKLAGVELSFTDCPICGDSKVIERELRKLNLSFNVALDKPARANLFDIFELEVRSIGLEPSCKMFDDTPAAIVIGGQVTFAETGDVVRAECDFHKIYIAPPREGFLPRIKCEGLGVAIRLGSALEIEGKVVAVDGSMPANVLESRRPDNALKADGNLATARRLAVATLTDCGTIAPLLHIARRCPGDAFTNSTQDDLGREGWLWDPAQSTLPELPARA